jgi:hypothetical protein
MQCRNHGFQGFPLSCVGQFQNAAHLYSSQEGQVVDNSDSSRGVATNARVRQGCVLTPIFFFTCVLQRAMANRRRRATAFDFKVLRLKVGLWNLIS